MTSKQAGKLLKKLVKVAVLQDKAGSLMEEVREEVRNIAEAPAE